MIRVVVVGAAGRMGRETLTAVSEAPGLELVGAVDRSAEEGWRTPHIAAGTVTDLPVTSKLGACLAETTPDVLIDFTHLAAAPANAMQALERGISPVIGTSGLSSSDVQAIRSAALSSGVPAAIIPNFAVGAVLMMRFAEMAAPFMPHCEVIEMHHGGKLDSPSGTAASTCERIAAARQEMPSKPRGTVEKIAGARGGDAHGVRVHSVRLPGFVAAQEVIFGGEGERLSLRHESIDRKSFMGGVVLAAQNIRSHKGLVIGLDALMFNTPSGG